jgi:hypothetical protein
LHEVRTRLVAFESLADLEGARLFFKNVNAPSDYDDASKLLNGE